MSALRKALCTMGWHSGEWSLPDSRCQVVRICDSCGKREEEPRHIWGRFSYIDDGQCDQIRRCGRCGSTESRSRHEWGGWVYLDEELVTARVHTCRRCHQTERTRRYSVL
jgi:hypothetical protein